MGYRYAIVGSGRQGVASDSDALADPINVGGQKVVPCDVFTRFCLQRARLSAARFPSK